MAGEEVEEEEGKTGNCGGKVWEEAMGTDLLLFVRDAPDEFMVSKRVLP